MGIQSIYIYVYIYIYYDMYVYIYIYNDGDMIGYNMIYSNWLDGLVGYHQNLSGCNGISWIIGIEPTNNEE